MARRSSAAAVVARSDTSDSIRAASLVTIAHGQRMELEEVLQQPFGGGIERGDIDPDEPVVSREQRTQIANRALLSAGCREPAHDQAFVRSSRRRGQRLAMGRDRSTDA